MTWFLTNGINNLDIAKDTARYAKGITKLQDNFRSLIAGDLKENIDTRIQSGINEGLPKNLAEKLAALPALASACDIIRVAATENVPLKTTASAYFEAGQEFQIEWLRNKAHYISSDNRWQNEAAQGLIDQLYSCQAGLAARIIRDTEGKSSKNQSLMEKWLENHEHLKQQIVPLLAEIKQAGTVNLPMLVLAEQRLRNLYGGKL